MRFSPILLAGFTVAAALGLSNPANAQVTHLVQGAHDLEELDQKASGFAPAASETGKPSNLPTLVDATEPLVSSHPERFGAEFLAQATDPIEATDELDSPDPDSEAGEPIAPVDSATPSETDVLPEADTSPDETPVLDETPTDDLPTDIAPTLEPAPVPDVPATDEEAEPPDIEPSLDGSDEIPSGDPGQIQLDDLNQPPQSPSTQQTDEAEPRVLVAEVVVDGVEGDLQNLVYDAASTQPGRTTTRSQLQEDINAIFATGYFSDVRAVPEDTPLGVRVTFYVDSNPVLQSVQLGNTALETLTVDGEAVPVQQAVDDVFSEQYGEILNFRDLQQGIVDLNQLYQDNGYVLAQVVDAPEVSDDGVVTLQVAEGVIEDIRVRFLDEEGNATDEEGNPIDGKTRDFIITREFESAPGDLFNQQQIQTDLQRVFGLGIFEDVRITLDPGDDPEKVDVVVNVTERNTGSFAAGLGFSSSTGLFGTVSLQEQNFGGNNQRLAAEAQVGLGLEDFLFDVSFTDPWIGGDPYRTSYTLNVFNRLSVSSIFDGGDNEVELPNGDRPRINRLGGGVTFSRPLDEWLGLDNWRASAGIQYQRVSIQDSDGNLSPEDEEGNDLSFSGTGRDDLLTVQIAAVNDLRNNSLEPTSGSLLRLSTEQSIPVGTGSILFNRLRASYSYYIPVDLTNFTDGAEALAFNVQGGTILGDLPPYEAFALGGTDSVRGYDFGELGSGRSFLQATVEYRFPIISIVGGALFVDFGTDLGTADDVPGNPAGIRDKPGSGFGYGAGVRVQTPLGQIRVDYGINDEGDGRLHFGIGERF